MITLETDNALLLVRSSLEILEKSPDNKPPANYGRSFLFDQENNKCSNNNQLNDDFICSTPVNEEASESTTGISVSEKSMKKKYESNNTSLAEFEQYEMLVENQSQLFTQVNY